MKDYVVELERPDFEIRTDLAVEEKESFPGDGGEIAGVSLREWHEEDSCIKVTEVKILDGQGARAMRKPEGTYLTLEADCQKGKEDRFYEEAAAELSCHIRRMIAGLIGKPEEEWDALKILVVGLGNSQVTPDSLGPEAVGQLPMTRHLESQYGTGFLKERHLPSLSGIAPGVMAQTGMETAEILQGIIQETKPELLIAIDALAARSIRRLGTTIQLTDTGIHPGSGVGNHRHGLTRKSLGIPVLSIGVPTVVGAAAIVHDTVAALIQVLAENEGTRGMGQFIENMESDEQYMLIRELLEPEFGSLFVTPPDIDETIRRLSTAISEGIQRAVFDRQDKGNS